jgi:NADP-dependent 3-hydroxy acid dehydrogenase YdfG
MNKEHEMNANISGKTIVITGGSSGMGAAAARHLACEGANVVVAARRVEKLDALVTEITQAGGKAVAVAVDVTRREDVQKLVDTAVKKFGRIDVLINNAGLMPLSPLERLRVEEWDQMIDVNLRGVLHGIAAALPYMKEQKSGQIINTASVAAYKLFPTAAVYCATKFAVRALSEGLRQEVKPYNSAQRSFHRARYQLNFSTTSARRMCVRPTRTMSARSASRLKALPVWSRLRSASLKTWTSTRSFSGLRRRTSDRKMLSRGGSLA